MIAVIFEVLPAAGRKTDYLEHAARLKGELERMDGFISVERFQSLTPISCCPCLSGVTTRRSLAGAAMRAIARRRRPAARASSATIACSSLL